MAKYLAKYLSPKAISTVGGFAIQPKGLVEGSLAGAHKSPFHGFSVEFAGHREYLPGDDPKHIDWNVYYKRDRYFIKQYEAETNMICQLLLDASESMRFGSGETTKLDYASYLVVSLAYLITNVRDSLGIAIFDEKIQAYLPASNSLAMVHKVNHILEELEPTKKTEFEKTLMDFSERIGRRQLVVLVSDFLEDPELLSKGLSRLRYDHHEVVVFQVLDPREIDFKFEGRYKFKGLEGFPEIKLNPKQVQKAYLEKFQAHQKKLREVCERNQAEYVEVNIEKPIEEVLFAYLTSRLTHINH